VANTLLLVGVLYNRKSCTNNKEEDIICLISLDPKTKMVFFDSSDSVKKGGKKAADEEPTSLPCSCLSPRRWKKGGRDNELSDIIKSFDEKDDNEVVLDESVEVEAVEEDTAAEEVEETPEGGEIETSDGAAADSKDVPVSEETCVGADDAEDKKEAQDRDDGEEKENEEEEEVSVTEEAKKEANEELEMPDDDEDVRKSLLKLSKTKPHKPKPPRTPKKALFDDIPDDDSEASIEVLFRYMGCTQEAYGERYQNPTISASETIDTVNTMHTTGTYEDNDNDVIENIETIGTTDDNDDTKETANTDTKETADTDETTDDDDDDLLRSPSGTLLITDENDNEEATEPMDIGDTPNDEQLDDTTPNDEQLDETTPQALATYALSAPTDEKLDVTTPDEQLNGADEPSRAVDENVTEEQTSSTATQPVFTGLAVDTKAAVSDKPPQIDPKSAARDKVVSRVINSAKSPSVRKIALALQNAPKYPTTDYTAATNQVTECSEKENAGDSGSPSATKKEEKNAKEVNTKGALAGPTATLKASGSLSKVEEMDALIKSTRAWLHTQKAERKVMDNITAKAVSPTNARNAALPEMKKLETSLPETKSPSLTKIPLSPQPLSPRTLDSLLLSRKTAPSSGPKKSILEQLEEIRAKQRERESRAISPRSP
jgi:hypothetical protein